MNPKRQGNGGPDGRPRCFNGEPMSEYEANDGTVTVLVNDVPVQALRTKRIPWAFSTECKSWAGHPGSDPVPLMEGWKCDGCRHFPHELVQAAVYRSLTRD